MIYIWQLPEKNKKKKFISIFSIQFEKIIHRTNQICASTGPGNFEFWKISAAWFPNIIFFLDEQKAVNSSKFKIFVKKKKKT